jgi:glutaredoxin-dependent peroxiredoxin
VKAFQQNLQKLEASDTQVLGVSMDSPFANHAFAEQNGVKFPLLGDPTGVATKDYGLEQSFDIGGVKVASARRATFLIDKDGKITETQVDKEAVDPTKIVTVCERKKKTS